MDEIVCEFLAESAENLDRLDRDLVALTRDPQSPALLAGAFRTLHTIKGTSGCLGLHRLEELTHAGETLLARLRDRELALTPPVARLLCELTAGIRLLLARIAATGSDHGADVDRVLHAVRTAATAEQQAIAEQQATAEQPIAVERPAVTGQSAASEQSLDAESFGTDRLDGVGEPAVRVPAGHLDVLLRLAGELVGTGEQLAARAELLADPELLLTVRRLDRIAGELRSGVLRSRLQPLELVWSRFPRLVRALGDQCGKRVRLQLTGGETELDRGVLEAIRDPLTHLVRNAVDHGIEQAAQRVAAGKPAHGTLRLHAHRTDGQVVVEVADDGAGIDLRAVGSGALARGLVTGEQLAAMSVGELRQLVFQPGLTTARTVTRVSGRGVGMDVVKTNVERIGGTVEIDSEPGRGTTCRLRVPRLPLAEAMSA